MNAELSLPEKKDVSKNVIMAMLQPDGVAIEALPPREQSHVKNAIGEITDKDIDDAIDKLPS
jgi:ACT domain-containing protein